MKKLNRRQFTRLIGTAAVAAPVASKISIARAQELPMVDPKSEAALGLEFVTQSTTEAQCSKCTWFAGAADASIAPCTIFPGSSVPNTGWCRAFSPKP